MYIYTQFKCVYIYTKVSIYIYIYMYYKYYICYYILYIYNNNIYADSIYVYINYTYTHVYTSIVQHHWASKSCWALLVWGSLGLLALYLMPVRKPLIWPLFTDAEVFLAFFGLFSCCLTGFLAAGFVLAAVAFAMAASQLHGRKNQNGTFLVCSEMLAGQLSGAPGPPGLKKVKNLNLF